MSNVYVNLPVPAANGVGAWVDVSQLGPEKTITVDGGPFSGILYVEGTNDAQASAASIENKVRTSSDLFMASQVLPFTTPTPVPVVIAGVYQFMRVRREQTGLGAGTPTVRIGAEVDTFNIFAAMNVPPSGSVGTPTDLTLGGAYNTFTVVGPVQQRVTIEVSEDGTNFGPALVFDSGSGTSQTFFGTIKAARVRRDQVLDTSATTLVAVGSGGGSGTGPVPPGQGILEFDSIALVGTMLSTFDTTGLLKGAVAYVGNDTFPGQNSVQDYFSLCYGENLTPDGITIVNSPTFGVDGAQWKRMNIVNPRWLAATDWALNSIGGNDENSGTDPLFPLRTMQEANRRQIGQYIDGRTVEWHQETSIDDPEFAVMDNVRCSPTGKAVWAGPISATTRVFPAAAINWTTRSATAEYQAAAAGIGVPGTMILLNQTRNSYAVTTEIIDANTVSVTLPRTCNPDTGDIGSPDEWVDGDLVSGYQPLQLAGWPWPAAGQGYVVGAVEFSADIPADSEAQLGGSRANIVACLAGSTTWIGGDLVTFATVGFSVDTVFRGCNAVLAGCRNQNGFMSAQQGTAMEWRDYFSLHGTAIIEIDDSVVEVVPTGEVSAADVGIFDVNGASAISCLNQGSYLGARGQIYGSNNVNAQWVEVDASSDASTASIVGTTTSVAPLTVNGVTYAIAARPIVDSTVLAAIR